MLTLYSLAVHTVEAGPGHESKNWVNTIYTTVKDYLRARRNEEDPRTIGFHDLFPKEGEIKAVVRKIVQAPDPNFVKRKQDRKRAQFYAEQEALHKREAAMRKADAEQKAAIQRAKAQKREAELIVPLQEQADEIVASLGIKAEQFNSITQKFKYTAHVPPQYTQKLIPILQERLPEYHVKTFYPKCGRDQHLCCFRGTGEESWCDHQSCLPGAYFSWVVGSIAQALCYPLQICSLHWCCCCGQEISSCCNGDDVFFGANGLWVRSGSWCCLLHLLYT